MTKATFLAASVALVFTAAAAHAQDPVSLLTAGDDVAKVIRLADATMPVTEPVARIVEKPVIYAPAATVRGPGKVDLAGLYFYARNKEDARVKAEFARLKLKYPDFQLPKDLYAPEPEAVDEKPLWTLYEKADFAGVSAEIARLQAANPGWVPSEDFLEKLDRKKMRVAMKAALGTRNWQGVLAAGAKLDPERESDVDLLWDMIDAYAETGRKDLAAPFYRGILFRTAGKPFDRKIIIATIRKSTRDFSPQDVKSVMAQFASDPEIAAGLAGISTDLVRKDVADFNLDKTKTAPLPKTDVDALVSAASSDNSVKDFSLLGWYYMKVKEPAEAGAWFRRALDAEPMAEHAKGLYLALVDQNRQAEAYDIALKYRDQLKSDPVFLLNALAQRIAKPGAGAVDADAIRTFADLIVETKSADHAEILGWYAYNGGQFEAARAWFSKAFGWEPKATRLKGMALAAGQLGDKASLVDLYGRYQAQYPDIWNDVHLAKGRKKKVAATLDKINVGAVDKAATPPFLNEGTSEKALSTPRRAEKSASAPRVSGDYLSSRQFGKCAEAMLAAEEKGALSAQDQLTKGWCMLGLNRNTEAKIAFSKALSGGGTVQQDAAYGLALTLLRNQLTDQAQSVIDLYKLSAKRDAEIRREVYWQKARSAFDHKDYQATLDALNARLQIAPEPADMSQLRAWAHFNLGHTAEAREIFRRLSDYMDDPAAKRGLMQASGSASRMR